jgi:beta-hydroxylase
MHGHLFHWLFVGILAGGLVVWLICALLIHFRGKRRHKFKRQFTDHSTFMAPYNALIYLCSAVKNDPILKIDDFPELKPLRENWETIREEARRLYEAGHINSPEKRNDLAFNAFFKRGWRRFYLKWYDDFLPSAKEICPKTVELVQAIPSVHAALFALLPPRSKLGEHRDPFAGSLRYHLGLITPNSDDCRIYIDGEPYAWRDGQDIIFDETFIHSVNNDTDQDRLILFCDVTRPIANPIIRQINDFVIHCVLRHTAAQNRDTEKIGFFNRFSSYFYNFRKLQKSLKQKNRQVYKLASTILTYMVVLLVVSLILYTGWRHW